MDIKNKYFLLSICIILITIIFWGYKMENKTVFNSSPTKTTITAIVPFAAGGSADMLVRMMEGISKKYLKYPMIINNIPGGGGTIGWNALSEAKPDSYTIGTITTGTILQRLYGKSKYDYTSAIEPIVQVFETPICMVVSANNTWNNVEDVIQYAKEHPNVIKFGHSGIGSSAHITGELFAEKAGIKLVQVPFQGESESLAALLGGHVQIIFITMPVALENIKAEKAKILGVAGEKRITVPECQGIRTFREQGLDVVISVWQGIGVPKMMPDKIKNELAVGLRNIVQDPAYIKNLESVGIELNFLAQEDFKNKWISETERYEKILKETKMFEKLTSQEK